MIGAPRPEPMDPDKLKARRDKMKAKAIASKSTKALLSLRKDAEGFIAAVLNTNRAGKAPIAQDTIRRIDEELERRKAAGNI